MSTTKRMPSICAIRFKIIIVRGVRILILWVVGFLPLFLDILRTTFTVITTFCWFVRVALTSSVSAFSFFRVISLLGIFRLRCISLALLKLLRAWSLWHNILYVFLKFFCHFFRSSVRLFLCSFRFHFLSFQFVKSFNRFWFASVALILFHIRATLIVLELNLLRSQAVGFLLHSVNVNCIFKVLRHDYELVYWF